MLVDHHKERDGKLAEASLEEAGIACNKNGIPFDPEKPAVTSGIRLGAPAFTTAGSALPNLTVLVSSLLMFSTGWLKIPKTMAKWNRLFDKKSSTVQKFPVET